MPKTTQEIYEELLAKGNEAQQQANDLLAAYDNRGQFSYDAMKDPMYLAAKDQYTRMGQKAMKDTMGQAAGLTGGYGNTYAQNVGNQAYDDYMTKLSSVGAEYANQARAAWDAEGQRMLDRYGLALNAANNYYNQGRDALADQRYEDELAYNRDWQQKQWDYNTQQQAQSDARSYATYLLGMGIMPTAEQLAEAGMTQQEANGIKNYYLNQQYAATAGSGGGGKTPSYTPKPKTADENDDDGSPAVVEDDAIPEAELKQYVTMLRTKGYDAALAAFSKAYDPKTQAAIDAWSWIVSQSKTGGSIGGGMIQPKPRDFVMPY